MWQKDIVFFSKKTGGGGPQTKQELLSDPIEKKQASIWK
jgi:hypothetical protein